jgi:tetratricopeptide (TPR) repeat protein
MRSQMAPVERLATAHEAYLQAIILEDEGQYPYAVQALLSGLYYDDSDPWLYFKTARMLRDLRRSQDALPLVRKAIALKAKPEAVDWEFLAGVFLDLGEKDSARTALSRAVAADPASKGALAGLALLAERDNKPMEAAVQYAQLARIVENSAPLAQKAYSLWAKIDRTDSMLSLSQSLWALRSSVPDGELAADLLSRKGRIQEALAILDTIGRRGLDDDSLRPALLTVRCEMQAGRMDTAVRRLQALMMVSPEEADQGLVGGLMIEGDSAETVRGLLISLAKQVPGNPRYPDLIGSIHLARGQWDSARKWLDLALLQDSTRSGAWARRCLVELEAERNDAAVDLARRYTARLPSNGRARWVRVQALERLAQSRLKSKSWENPPPESEPEATALREEAILQLDTAARLDTSIPQLRFERASLLERVGRFDESCKEMRAIVAQDSSNHMAMNYLGYVLADRNLHLDEAEILLDRALALSPGNGAYLDSRGWLHYRQGRFDQALADIDSSMQKHRSDEVILEHHALILEAMGRKEQANRDWTLLLERIPGYAPALAAIKRLGLESVRSKH